MKLIVEVVDYYNRDALEYGIGTRIIPNDSREGISTLDKYKQTEKLARLMDLSEAVKDAVGNFYENRAISSPRDSISTSGEPWIK